MGEGRKARRIDSKIDLGSTALTAVHNQGDKGAREGRYINLESQNINP